MSQCQWVWLGNAWGQQSECPTGQHCEPPVQPGRFVGDVEFTTCEGAG